MADLEALTMDGMSHGNPIEEMYGAIAQLGERLLCTQEVSSSILLSSTTSGL